MNNDFICSGTHNQEWGKLGHGVSNSTLLSILNSSRDSIFLIEPSGTILFANKAMSNRLKTPVDKLIGQDINSFFQPEIASRRGACVQEVVETRRPVYLQDNRDNINFESHFYPILDENGVVVHVAIFAMDITERKMFENILCENEKKANEEKKLLELVLDTIPSRLFWKDKNGIFLGCNRLFAQDAGKTDPEEIVGLTDYDMVWRDQAELYRRDDSEVMISGEPKLNYEEPQTSPSGEQIWISTSKVPLQNSQGKTIGILGAYEDITDRKRYEEQLRIAYENLEQLVEQRTRELQETYNQYLHSEKLSAIGKLSASIAHEFNNPLQGIISILKGIRKRVTLDVEDRELLDAAISETDRIKELIRNLQDFNRPSPNQKELINLYKILVPLLRMFRNELKSRRITLECDLSQELPQIIAVPDQLKQVFLNLLANAADACQERRGTITVRAWHNNGVVAIAIKDTGVGIEPEKQSKIFDPFYTTKGETKGTGLGLSVSSDIVKAHRGEIRVESKHGEGSTFTVLLPVAGSLR